MADELPEGVLPFNSFSFNINTIDSAIIPTPIYAIQTASTFEVCSLSGIKVGVLAEQISLINGSSQGIGSRWVVLNVRTDIDIITLRPVGSRAGYPTIKIPLWHFRRHFAPLGLFENKI